MYVGAMYVHDVLLVQHELKFQKGEIDASFTIIYKLKLVN